jgi:hypothetical protein
MLLLLSLCRSFIEVFCLLLVYLLDRFLKYKTALALPPSLPPAHPPLARSLALMQQAGRGGLYGKGSIH